MLGRGSAWRQLWALIDWLHNGAAVGPAFAVYTPQGSLTPRIWTQCHTPQGSLTPPVWTQPRRQPGHVGSWNEWLTPLRDLSHNLCGREKGCESGPGRRGLPGSSTRLWMPALTHGLSPVFAQTVPWVRNAIALELEESGNGGASLAAVSGSHRVGHDWSDLEAAV